jgi:hypothetical protein
VNVAGHRFKPRNVPRQQRLPFLATLELVFEFGFRLLEFLVENFQVLLQDAETVPVAASRASTIFAEYVCSAVTLFAAGREKWHGTEAPVRLKKAGACPKPAPLYKENLSAMQNCKHVTDVSCGCCYTRYK